MSCITVIGRHTYFGEECDVPLPHSSPEWTDTKRGRLVDMALDSDPWKRAVAAAHPKLPEGLLPILGADDHVLVRMALLKNPTHGRRVATMMCDDEDPRIRAYIELVTLDD